MTRERSANDRPYQGMQRKIPFTPVSRSFSASLAVQWRGELLAWNSDAAAVACAGTFRIQILHLERQSQINCRLLVQPVDLCKCMTRARGSFLRLSCSSDMPTWFDAVEQLGIGFRQRAVGGWRRDPQAQQVPPPSQLLNDHQMPMKTSNMRRLPSLAPCSFALCIGCQLQQDQHQGGTATQMIGIGQRCSGSCQSSCKPMQARASTSRIA